MKVLQLIALMDIPDDSDKLVEEICIKVTPTDKHTWESMPREIKCECLKDMRKTLRGYGHMSKKIEATE